MVLLLIDVINDFAFPQAPQLLRYAAPAANRLAKLKSRLRDAGIPSIYVNDNFGRWRSDFKEIASHCMSGTGPGNEIARLLMPAEDDYFVLKPKHSGFFSTALEVLLRHLGARQLIISGFAADICVLFTANDAYMRGFKVIIPSDCIAAESLTAHRNACVQMERFAGADIRDSRSVVAK